MSADTTLPEQEIAEIDRLEEERWAALVMPDTAKLAELFDDEMVYTHSNGMPDSKATYVANIGAGTYRYSRIDREDVRIRLFGATAVVTGRARIVSALEAGEFKVVARFSAVWAHNGGRWRFVCWHACPDTTV